MVTEVTRETYVVLKKASRPIYDYKFGLLTIHKQRWFASIDNTVHRLHTNITNLKSELRYCLRYNNQDLVCVDIKNSQPYLSILLLNAAFYASEDEWQGLYHHKDKGAISLSILHSITPIQSNISIPLSFFSNIYNSILLQIPPLIMILVSENLSETGETIPENDILTEICSYINHAAKGTLYEHIRTSMEAKGLPVPDSRKELKAIVFQVLFTDNRFKGQEDAAPKRVFQELFPTVTKVFELIKKKDSTLLPILLQQLESTIFLDRITKRISEEQPQLPIFTIHDSIMTLKGNEDYVSAIIKEECKKAVGVAPALSIEYYDDQGIQNVINKLQLPIAPTN